MTLLASVLPLDLGSPRSVAAYLLVLAHTLPLAVRRRWPVAVLAAGLVTGAAFALLGLNLVVLTFALLVYVYILAGLLRQPGLERWLPMGAAAVLTRPGDGTLPMWAGALGLAGYGLALALLGGRLLVRRDLT